MTSQKYEELTATELAQALEHTSLVYVPIGSLEFHGSHLPLGTDTINAYEFCLLAAQQTGGVVLPPTYWNAHGHVGWTGSLLVRERTFRAIVRDIFALLSEQGVRLVVASTGHWPEKQGVTIARLAREAMRERPRTRILVLDPFGCNFEDPRCDHGGKKETSLMLALRPELVHLDKLREVDDPLRGIYGLDPAEGNPEYGSAYFNTSLGNCVDLVNEALNELRNSST